MPKTQEGKTSQVSEFTSEMFDSDDFERLSDLLKLVKPGSPWKIPTILLLKLNGNSKRGKHVNGSINDALKERGLVSTPPIESADYYGKVVISDPRDDIATEYQSAALPLSAFPGELNGLRYFGRETTVAKVKATMVSLDISQIPILSTDRKTLFGVVTWRSLALAAGVVGSEPASSVMSNAGHVANSSDDFLELVDTIISQEFVLYRAPDGRISGIVTASDLAQAFESTAGIYIRLQELENRLRVLLDRSPIPKLQEHLDPRRRQMSGFRGASDMMFGEYLSALGDDEVWDATRINFDRDTCLKLLNAAKEVRNGVMHFSSRAEDDSEEDIQRQADVVNALRLLRAVDSTK